jgi:REP element-mobilizing transposase RayT
VAKLVRYQCGCFHFVTFSCYRRQALLGTATAYGVFERELEAVRVRYGFVVAGYVPMPEHVHLPVGEPSRSSLSIALQVLKTADIAQAEATWRGSVLAAPLLRFQRLERREAGRETALHASQPGHTRSGRGEQSCS